MDYEMKNSIINKEFTSMMLKKEFKCSTFYEPKEGSTWLFEKENYIVEIFDKFIYLNMRFYLKGQEKKVYIKEFDLKNSCEADKVDAYAGYSFENDEEFKKIISDFKSLFLEQGEKIFNELQKKCTVQIQIKKAYYDYIKQNKTIIIEKFENENRMKTMEQQFDFIRSDIVKLKQKNLDNIVYELLDDAIFYGEWLIHQYGGKWGEFGEVYIVDEIGTEKRWINPISYIFDIWSGQEKMDFNMTQEMFGKDHGLNKILEKYGLL